MKKLLPTCLYWLTRRRARQESSPWKKQSVPAIMPNRNQAIPFPQQSNTENTKVNNICEMKRNNDFFVVLIISS